MGVNLLKIKPIGNIGDFLYLTEYADNIFTGCKIRSVLTWYYDIKHILYSGQINIIFKYIVILFSITIYIYIVIHRQICFVLSELISVARHISFP